MSEEEEEEEQQQQQQFVWDRFHTELRTWPFGVQWAKHFSQSLA
jgi:hypothetical protein